ncbi:MAG TPA: antibiotic biosynthesis monooxygenase [bacterium]|jgi:quinol monooxygenase YgiN
MVKALVNHKVADYNTWLPHFEKHAEKRVPAGCLKAEVFRNSDDPNNVFILFDWKDADSFKKFGESPDLAETMKAAGVMGPPTMTILESANNYPG